MDVKQLLKICNYVRKNNTCNMYRTSINYKDYDNREDNQFF